MALCQDKFNNKKKAFNSIFALGQVNLFVFIENDLFICINQYRYLPILFHVFRYCFLLPADIPIFINHCYFIFHNLIKKKMEDSVI